MLKGLHHIALRVTDLAVSKAFAEDFGLKEATADDAKIFLRGTGTSAYSVVLERASSPGLAAIAFEAENASDLEQFVLKHGASPVRSIEAPGGGIMVEMTDPAGRVVRIVHGVATRQPEAQPPGLILNQGEEKPRRGLFQNKSPAGPSSLLRLGHVGLFITNWPQFDSWYREVLGLIPSDVIYAGAPENVIAAFYRINRGDEWVDHHTVAVFQMGKDELHHVSFEVQNLEVQFMGHRWMSGRKHELIWGVGRHPLGSHIFDVWRDPNGYRFETFSDTDLLNASMPTYKHPVDGATMDLWSDRDVGAYFA